MVEAGTGVGKTFSYLVPALLSGERVLAFTATKALQDQLYARDLPRLVQAWPARALALLGAWQLPVSAPLGTGAPRAVRPTTAVWRRRWPASNSGPDYPLGRPGRIARAGRTVGGHSAGHVNARELSGVAMSAVSACHVLQARREALEADIVVINHHLFLRRYCPAGIRGHRIAADGARGGVR